METIKNYLENMFMHLPNTAEVRRAKDELWQMMEDKYTELIEQGKTENEAVGTVISEFGNLNDLAEELGIGAVMNPRPVNDNQNNYQGQQNQNMANNIPRKMVTMDEAFDYLRDRASTGFKIALGVMIILLGIAGTIAIEALISKYDLDIIPLIIGVAIAVALFVFAGTKMSKWEYLTKVPCAIDYATSKAVESERSKNIDSLTVIRTIGIVLCILCFIPAAVLDEMNINLLFINSDDMGGVLLFVFVAIGVFMIIYSSLKIKGYQTLLSLNDINTVSGAYVQNNFERQKDEKTLAGKIHSVFWPTITCIYLSWSFLSFDWHITWVIWPIAAVVSPLINILFKE